MAHEAKAEEAKKRGWKHVRGEDADGPMARLHHTACAFESQSMLMLGGKTNSGRYAGDAWVLNQPTDAQTSWWWHKLPLQSKLQSVRGATLLSWRGKTLFLTGMPDSGDSVMHLYCLRYSDSNGVYTWDWLPAGGSLPSCRIGHCVCVVGAFLVVFGGVGGTTRMPLEGTHILDLEEMFWHEPGIVHGDEPSPRSEHAAVPCDGDTRSDGGRMLLFGGATANSGKIFNDLHELTISTDASQLEPTSTSTSLANGSAEDAATPTSHHGVSALWRSVVPAEGSVDPSPRAGHAASFLCPQNTLLVVGGGNGRHGVQNAAAFNLETKMWQEPWQDGPDPPFVGEGSTLVCIPHQYSNAELLVAFGGYNGRAMKDVYVLRLPTDMTTQQSLQSAQHAASEPRIMHDGTDTGKERQNLGGDAQGDEGRTTEDDTQSLEQLVYANEQPARTEREKELEEEVRRLREEAEQRNARLQEKDSERDRLERALEEQRNKALRAEAEAAEHARKAERSVELEQEVERLQRVLQSLRAADSNEGNRKQSTEGFLSWLGLTSSSAEKEQG